MPASSPAPPPCSRPRTRVIILRFVALPPDRMWLVQGDWPMAGIRLRRWVPLWVGVLAWAGLAAPLSACPFCNAQGETLVMDVNRASMVLFGTMTNARLDPNGGFGQGATDLQIEEVLKKHETLGDKKVLT